MKRILIAFLAFTLLQTALVYLWVHQHQKKIVYADAIRLFNNYKFKTDLEKMSQSGLGRLKAALDSAEAMLKVRPADEQMQQLVMEQQQRLAQGYSAVNKEINEKVWERLNLAIQKFGKEKKLDLMIGANGMGTVLYASEAEDITGELTQFVNKYYEHGN